MATLGRFARYWMHNLGRGKALAGTIISAIGGVMAAISLYLNAVGFPVPKWLESPEATGLASAIFIGSVLFVIFYRPFSRHAKLEDEVNSGLSIEGVTCFLDRANGTFCAVRVRNNGSKTADNVSVSLLEFWDDRAKYLPLPMPLCPTDRKSLNNGEHTDKMLLNVRVGDDTTIQFIPSQGTGTLEWFKIDPSKKYRVVIQATSRDAFDVKEAFDMTFEGNRYALKKVEAGKAS